jgi:hypothetical protein
VTGTTSFTVSVQGLDANGDSKTTSQVYTLEVSDPDGFPNKLNMTFSGYTGSSTLSNFPLLVELHEGINGFAYNSFISGVGNDLRFFDGNGRELEYDVEKWDTNGRSVIWVKMVELNTNSTLLACWGNSSESAAPSYLGSGSVWSNNFSGVWHFNEKVAGKFTDSSGKGNFAQAYFDASASAAQIGNGLALDGTDDYVDLGGNVANSASPYMASLWVKGDASYTSGSYERILSSKSAGSTTEGFGLYESSNNRLTMKVGNSAKWKTVHNWVDAQWHHIAFGLSGNQGYLFADGVDQVLYYFQPKSASCSAEFTSRQNFLQHCCQMEGCF